MEFTMEDALEQFEDNGLPVILEKGVWSAEDVAEIKAHAGIIMMFFEKLKKKQDKK